MNFLLLANAFVGLLISILIIINHFRLDKNNLLKAPAKIFFYVIFCYIAFSSIIFVWLFNFLQHTQEEILFIFAAAIFFQTILLYFSVYYISKKREFNYFLFLCIFSLLVAYLSFYKQTLFFLLTSFLLTLFVALRFFSPSINYKKSGHVCIIYSLIGLLSTFLMFFINQSEVFILIINIVFFLFIYYFYKDLFEMPHKDEKLQIKEKNKLLLFIKYFAFIIVFVNLILISTIGVHELSHVLAARYYGCESRAIFYQEGQYPYSEISCDNTVGKTFITLAGPALPLLIGLLMFLLNFKFMRASAFLIIGLNLIASSRDYVDLSFSKTAVIAFIIAGLVFVLLGILFLAREGFEEEIQEVN